MYVVNSQKSATRVTAKGSPTLLRSVANAKEISSKNEKRKVCQANVPYRSLLFHGLCSTKSRRGRNQQKCEIPKEPGGTDLMKSFVSPSLVLEPCLFLPRDFQIGRRHRPPRIGNSRLVRKKFGDKAYRVRRTRILPNGSAFTVETGIPRTNKDINTTCSVDRASIYAAEISFSAGGSTAHACSRTRRTPAIIRLDKRRSTDHTDLSRSRQHLSRFFIVKVPRKILDLALCS